MIKRISVTNNLDETLDFDLFNPEKSGLAITEVQGLGPPKSTINTTPLPLMDGSMFSSSRLEPRTIQITFRYMWAPTIEASRKKTYRYFPIGREVRLQVETDAGVFEVNGYVESNEPTIFSEASSGTVTLNCPDPYFYEVVEDGTQDVIFYSVEPRFQFEFSNNSLVEPTLIMSEILEKNLETVVYKGDIDTGVLIYFRTVGYVKNPAIYNVTTQESIKIDSSKVEKIVENGFVSGDEIIISTVRGSKGAYLKRAGKFYNVLSALGRSVSWFGLRPGENSFGFSADEGGTNLRVTLRYRTVYGGI